MTKTQNGNSGAPVMVPITITSSLTTSEMDIYDFLQTIKLCHFRYEEVADLCRKLLVADPTMTDIWLCVAELYRFMSFQI